MVFIEDEDFQRLLDKIASLEAERDRAEGLLRSVESARKLQLTEGQLAELCDIKTKLLYSNEKVRDDQDGCEDEESAPVALLDGELGAEPRRRGGCLRRLGGGGGGGPSSRPRGRGVPREHLLSRGPDRFGGREARELVDGWVAEAHRPSARDNRG